jgi:hypothetical protein
MSRYSKNQTIDGLSHEIAYGHDHATGYFVQIYSLQYDEPVVEYDDLFGWHVAKHASSETVSTERMDRDPRNHLGARIAAELMPTKGTA